MMVSLRRPSTETIREFLASQSKLGFTYTAVGATASQPPAGYTVDHTRIKLGQGEEVFMEARDALRCREQFRLGWMEAWSPKTTIEPGDVVAIIARNLGLWWLNACRIVYVVDEEEPIQRYGFASEQSDWELPSPVWHEFSLINPDGQLFGPNLIARSEAMRVLP